MTRVAPTGKARKRGKPPTDTGKTEWNWIGDQLLRRNPQRFTVILIKLRKIYYAELLAAEVPHA